MKQKIRLLHPFVRTVMISITFYGKYLRILELYQEKYSNSNQMIRIKQLSPKQYSNSNTN